MAALTKEQDDLREDALQLLSLQDKLKNRKSEAPAAGVQLVQLQLNANGSFYGDLGGEAFYGDLGSNSFYGPLGASH
jgi:hypothetical protein